MTAIATVAAATAPRQPPKKPVVAVIGTTGVGKSHLALCLAKRFNGELINTDALQMYRGLPIATNKPTADEVAAAPHHLVGVWAPDVTGSIVAFSEQVHAAIDAIHARGKLPIIVGGTSYYVQAALWTNNTSPDNAGETSSSRRDADGRADGEGDADGHADGSANPAATSKQAEPDMALPHMAAVTALLAKIPACSDTALRAHAADMRRLAHAVDPVMAARYHAANLRRLHRILTVYAASGRPMSAALTARPAPVLRYPTLVLWPFQSTEALYPRLDARVDAMVARGLLAELRDFHATWTAMPHVAPDQRHQVGLGQAIGYKEMAAYLALLDAGGPDGAATKPAEVETALTQGLDLVKQSTRRYAKRQLTWIRNKIAPALLQPVAATADSCSPPEGALRMLDLQDDGALEAAEAAAEAETAAFLAGKPLSDGSGQSALLAAAGVTQPDAPPSDAAGAVSTIAGLDTAKWATFTCESCRDAQGQPRTFNGTHEWHIHTRSRRHHRQVARHKAGLI